MKMTLKTGVIGILSCLSVACFSSSVNASGTMSGSINLNFADGTTLQWVRYNPYVSGEAQFGAISEYDGTNFTSVATGVFADGGMYKLPGTVGTPWVDSVSYGNNSIIASYDAFDVSFGMHAGNDPAMVFTPTYFSINPTIFFAPSVSFDPFSFTYDFSGNVDQPGMMSAAIQVTVGYSNSPYGTYGDVLYTNYLTPATQFPNAYNDPNYFYTGIVNSFDTGEMTKWVYANANGDAFVTPDGSEQYWYVTLSMGGNIYDYTGDPVPIPGAVWLLGSGIAALAGLRRKLKS